MGNSAILKSIGPVEPALLGVPETEIAKRRGICGLPTFYTQEAGRAHLAATT